MASLNLPAGRSLREIAEDLGVTVEELQAHANVSDTEAPLSVNQLVEIPDGFLRVADRNRRTTMAAVPESRIQPGLNSKLALELEYRRSLVSGGANRVAATDNDEATAKDLARIFRQLTPKANALTFDLAGTLAKSQNADMRAWGYAYRAASLALRATEYGQPPQTVFTESLSAAKSALMANPKLSFAQVSMGWALFAGGPTHYPKAREHLEQALEFDGDSSWGWAALAQVMHQMESPELVQVLSVADKLSADNAWALKSVAVLQLKAQQLEQALKNIQRLQGLEAPIAEVLLAAHETLRSGDDSNGPQKIEQAVQALEDITYRQHALELYENIIVTTTSPHP